MEILKFTPIYIDTVWGGKRISQMKEMEESDRRIGESWEISGVTGKETVVSEGCFAGLTLNKLIENRGEELLGEKVYSKYGTAFPLLIKFIDAADDLSIQVHPNDDFAQRSGKVVGKTEAWFVINAEPQSSVKVGFEQNETRESITEALRQGNICQHIKSYAPQAGDCFYIPAGQVHAIGAGLFVIEIQQTSDLTYRIFDYNRPAQDGKLRPLHIDKALACMNYAKSSSAHIPASDECNKAVPLIDCPFFTTHRLTLNEAYTLDCRVPESFRILICYDGVCTLTSPTGQQTKLCRGETVLIPAIIKTLHIAPETESVSMIMTYVDLP